MSVAGRIQQQGLMLCEVDVRISPDFDDGFGCWWLPMLEACMDGCNAKAPLAAVCLLNRVEVPL